MKKIFSVLIAVSMIAALAGCGNTSSASSAASTAASKTADSASTASASSVSSSKASTAASASDGKITSIADLKGKTVGVQTGTTGDIYITDDTDTAVGSVERYNSGIEAVQALSQGKIDAVIIDDQPAQTFVKQVSGLKILDTPYTEEDYAIALKKDNTDLLDKMNTALAALKSDGTLDKITSYYIDGKGESYKSPDGTSYPNGKLVMATNAEFPPYESVDDSQNYVGIDIDFAKAIGDKLGYEIEVSDMAFDSIITAVTSGKADFAMAGLTVTDERKQSVAFTDSYYTGKQAIIVQE